MGGQSPIGRLEAENMKVFLLLRSSKQAVGAKEVIFSLKAIAIELLLLCRSSAGTHTKARTNTSQKKNPNKKHANSLS